MSIVDRFLWIGGGLSSGVYCPVWSASASVWSVCWRVARAARSGREKSACQARACRGWRARRRSCSAYWGRACSHLPPPPSHCPAGSCASLSPGRAGSHVAPRGRWVWTCASADSFSLVAPSRRGTPGCSRTLPPEPACRGWREGCPVLSRRYCARCCLPVGLLAPHLVQGHLVAPQQRLGPSPVGKEQRRRGAETWRGWRWETWSGT